MIVVIASATVHPDRIEEAKALARTVEQATRQEPGCISYRFVQSIEDPTRFLAFEEWKTEADLASHFQQAHTQAFAAAVAPMLTSEMQVAKYDVASFGPL